MSSSEDNGRSLDRTAQQYMPNRDLFNLAHLLLVMVPAFGRARVMPASSNRWGDLESFIQRDDLHFFRPLLEVIREHLGEPTTDTINKAIAERAQSIKPNDLHHASLAALDSRRKNPLASLLLAWLALCVWITKASLEEQDLEGEMSPDGSRFPDPGWKLIPMACITIALQLQGLHGARLLAEKAHTVLFTNGLRHPDHMQALEPFMQEYRRLSREVISRYEMAIAGLVDDLLLVWNQSIPCQRLLAAVLWTLGLGPEAYAFLCSDQPPSRASLQRLVLLSIEAMPSDPLVQYLWLEIKQVQPLDLHSHPAIYVLLNHRWAQWSMDEMFFLFDFPAEPSRLYAKALVALLDDEPDQEQIGRFLQVYETIRTIGRMGDPRLYLTQRLDMLHFQLNAKLKVFSDTFGSVKQMDWLRKQVVFASEHRDRATFFPHYQDLGLRSIIAEHEYIERLYSADSPVPESERAAACLDCLETLRRGSLGYWLDIIPPLPPLNCSHKLVEMLEEERNLLTRIRGCYFLALRSGLPLHCQWCTLESDILFAINEDHEKRSAFYSADGAREEIRELRLRLTQLFERMESEAPGYASARRNPGIDTQRLSQLLGAHRTTCKT